MNDFIKKWKSEKYSEIKKLKEKYGQIYAKAFPGRAAILIKLLGLDENIISGVFEKDGSIKVGHFVPGTKIPILKDSQMSGLLQEMPVCSVLCPRGM